MTDAVRIEKWVEETLAEEVSAYAPHDWPTRLIRDVESRGYEVTQDDDSLEDLREAIVRLGWEATEE